jgi:hypothetical protein
MKYRSTVNCSEFIGKLLRLELVGLVGTPQQSHLVACSLHFVGETGNSLS